MKGNKVFPISRRCVSVDRVFSKARTNSDNELDASCTSDTRLTDLYSDADRFCCALVHQAVAPCTPFSLLRLRVARGPYRADPDVVINSRLHAAERPFAASDIQTHGNGHRSGVYKRLKNALGLQNTAKKPEGPIGFERRRRRPYVVL